jgi:hypothetical protein
MTILIENLVNGQKSTPTATPTANGAVVADGTGHIASGWGGVASSLAPLTAGTVVSPTFGGLGLNAATATNGFLPIGNGAGFTLAGLTGTANQVTVTNGAGTITLALPQDIAAASSPSFAALTLSGLTANSFLFSGTAGLLTSTTAPTNGQLLIGSTGVAPVAATLTGTANQVTVTNGAGSITLALPQSIATASSPQFAGLTLSGTLSATLGTISVNTPVVSASATWNAGGVTFQGILLNVTDTASAAASTLLDLQKATVSQFKVDKSGDVTALGTLTLSALTANSFIYSGTAGAVTTTTAPTNGQLLIGSTGAAPVAASLTGTANQVVVTPGAGSITLALPQSIATTSSPQFAALGLNVAAGATGTLSLTSSILPALGTITVNTPVVSATATWNAGGVSFQTFFANITDTASAAASTLIDLQTGSASQFKVDKSGNGTLASSLTVSGLTANSFLFSGAAGLLSTTTAPTNGQLLVGSTGAAPVAATITGTANQITVTNGAGSITLSTPQNINTAATPQFAALGIGAAAGASGITLADANNLILGTTTGTIIGTATTQKLSFFGATPVVQITGSTDVLAGLVTLGLRAASANPPLNLGTGALTAGATSISTLTESGKTTTYNGVATAGWGTPAIYGSGRFTAQAAAVASVATYTPTADGSFRISSNINVTATASGLTATVTYKDENGTSRTDTIPYVTSAGSVTTTPTTSGEYLGLSVRIRAQAGTAIVVATTWTSGTYNVEADITQAA